MDELSRLVVRWQETRDAATAERVIAGVKPGAYQVARRYERWDRPVGDLVSAALYGAWVAMGRFDASRGLKFFTLCVPYMHGYVQKQVRSEGLIRVPAYVQDRVRAGEAIALPTATLTTDMRVRRRDGEQSYSVEDTADEDRDELGAMLGRLDVERWLGYIDNPNQALVVRRIFVEGWTGYEVAAATGKSYQWVYSLAKKGLQRIRERMECDGAVQATIRTPLPPAPRAAAVA